MTVFDTSAPIRFKTSTPDWIADLEQSILDELFSAVVVDHSPVLVDCVGDTRYAICANCDQNIESWWYDGDDDRSPAWGAWGIRTEFGNGATLLTKTCKG